jgi:hypothetical protein
MPALDSPPRSRKERQLATSARALQKLDDWRATGDERAVEVAVRP